MPEEKYYNVSVRLKEEEYKKLEYIHEKWDKNTKGKVHLADVLREGVNALHLEELRLEEREKKEKEEYERLKAFMKEAKKQEKEQVVTETTEAKKETAATSTQSASFAKQQLEEEKKKAEREAAKNQGINVAEAIKNK